MASQVPLFPYLAQRAQPGKPQPKMKWPQKIARIAKENKLCKFLSMCSLRSFVAKSFLRNGRAILSTVPPGRMGFYRRIPDTSCLANLLCSFGANHSHWKPVEIGRIQRGVETEEKWGQCLFGAKAELTFRTP
jgi:hypothetical protein